MHCSDKIFCQVRKEWVSYTPEEVVRQKMLNHMIQDKGFIPSFISVEKALKQMPHLVSSDQAQIPDRRADIICFAKGIHPSYDLYPLIIVECKAVKLTPKMTKQVIGYNYFLKAAYICLANQWEVLTGYFNQSQQKYLFWQGLPSYSDLLSPYA